MGRGILLLVSGALLAAMAGCSLCRPCSSSCVLCTFNNDEAPPPLVERVPQDSAIRDVAASVASAQLADAPPIPIDYRAVAPLLCQCLSAKHAPMADGFDKQRRQLEENQAKASCLRTRKSEKKDKQSKFQESLLLYSALELRDQAAGVGLEWYYQLAGAEAKDDLFNAGLMDGGETLARIVQLKKLGLTLPAPLEEYQRQVVDLQAQKAQNQLAIERLNGKLRLAMGYSPKRDWRMWPDPGTATGETPIPLVPDVEAAVQLGLQQRPQLLLLRSAIANLDADTLGPARSLLQTINPLLAMSSPGPSCKLLKILGKILHIQPGQEQELERIRSQLCDDLHERERTVEAEIREAVYELHARRATIELARREVDSWKKRISDLKKQKAEGLEGELGLASASLELHKAHGEVIKEYIGWKIAGVKLKQAQGVLPAECGYSEGKECHHELHE